MIHSKKALRRCCEWLNVYYERDLAGTAGGGIVGYLADMNRNFRRFTKMSWDDTLAEEGQVVGTPQNSSVTPEEDRSPLVREGVAVFGEGFTEDAYPMMLRTYHGYIDPLGDTATAGQLKSARFLAALEYRCMEAIKADNVQDRKREISANWIMPWPHRRPNVPKQTGKR